MHEHTCHICNIEANLRAILDTITDSVIVIDDRGTIRLANPAASHLFGYEDHELLGKNMSVLMPYTGPERERHEGYLAAYIQRRRQLSGSGRELIARRRNGEAFPIHLSIGEFRHLGQRHFVGIIHDLSLRKQEEATLVMLSQAVEQTPAGVIITDLEGRIEYVNAGFVELTGLAADTLAGCSLRVLGTISPVFQSHSFWRCLLSGKDWNSEVQCFKVSGELFWAMLTFTPIHDAQGLTIRLLGRLQDITRQKRDQEALAESEDRFREVAKMVGEWLWEQDPQGNYTYSSSAVEDILGYRPEEIVGRHYHDLLTDEDRRLWQTSLPPIETMKAPFYRLTNHYRHRDGHEVYTESTGSPLLGQNGETLMWRGLDLDVTERMRAEEALRLRERAIDAASVGIAIAAAVEPDYPTIYVNPALCRITGYESHELIGKSLRMLQGRETDPASRQKIRDALDSGGHCELVIHNYRKDGTGFWNELLLSPVLDSRGRLTHYIGVIADVSERRKLESARNELEIARRIQMSLLPQSPQRLGSVELAGICVPAEQVGGDYYDFFRHGDHVDIVIADVSGHSVGAALIMAEMRSTLKAEIRRYQLSPANTSQMLEAINEILYGDLNGADLFITMFFLRYNMKTRHLRYANAGHNPPLLLRRNAPACIGLDTEGLVLGVNRNVSFEEKEMVLEPGDRLLFYTDGVTDAQSPDGDFYGPERLCRAVCDTRLLSPVDTIDALLARLHAFHGKEAYQDDFSMVVMQTDGA